MEGSNKAGSGRDAVVTLNLLEGTIKAFPTLKEETRIKAEERILDWWVMLKSVSSGLKNVLLPAHHGLFLGLHQRPAIDSCL
jgi:hypothetical protein